MKNYPKLAALFFLFFTVITHADTLHIYLNTSTCRACNLIGKQFEEFSSVSKILYISQEDFRVKEELLESYNFDLKSYEVKTFDKKLVFDNQRSFCVFQRGHFLSNKVMLGDVGTIRNLAKPKSGPSVKLKYDAKITLSDAVIVSLEGENVLFFDDKLNKLLVGQIKGDSIVLRYSFLGNNFSVKELEKCNCFDAKMYEHLVPILTQLNLTKPVVETCYLKNNVLSIMLGLEVGLVGSGSADTVIFKKLFIYSVNLSSKEENLICINKEGNYETDNVLGTKFAVLNSPFIKNKDTLYLPIVSSDSSKKSLFVKQLVTGKTVRSLGITKDLNYLVPTDFKFTFGTKGVFLSRLINESACFFVKAPFIYDIATKKTYFIHNKDLQLRLRDESAYISDAKVIEGKALFLLKESGIWYNEEYDLKSNNLISSKIIEADSSINYALFVFDNESLFLGSSSTSEFYLVR
jgi:hypothetical protein